jgi:hypothetical membrane protein
MSTQTISGSTTNSTTVSTSTRSLLTCAAIAAPLFAVVSLTQAFTRPGFDLTRNPLSQLSSGSLEWLQVANFLVTGALTVAGAVGLRRVLGRTWAPRLVLIAGFGMMAAGVFRLDPGNGFPVGTPIGEPTSMTWHSTLHLASGTVSFACTIAACFVLGRYFARSGRRGFAIASRVAAVVFLVGDGWATVGGTAGSLTLAIGALTGMLWVSVVAARLR